MVLNNMKSSLLTLTALIFMLSGCESAKESLGVGVRQAPDEFDVVTYDPLTLPPDYHLRPPQSGQRGPGKNQVEDKARNLVTGRQDQKSTEIQKNLSKGEYLVLKQAGAYMADPNIRQDIQKLASEASGDNIPFAKKLLGLGEERKPASIVDADQESRRIQESLKKGESITKGETPTFDD